MPAFGAGDAGSNPAGAIFGFEQSRANVKPEFGEGYSSNIFSILLFL